jgi:hypothetical protein
MPMFEHCEAFWTQLGGIAQSILSPSVGALIRLHDDTISAVKLDPIRGWKRDFEMDESLNSVLYTSKQILLEDS